MNASVNVNELTADIPGLDKPLEILFEGSFRDLPCTLEGSIGPIMAWIQPDRILPMDLKARLGNASAKVVAFLADTDGGGAPWHCPACGEHSEAQFTACWSCGAERPQPID